MQLLRFSLPAVARLSAALVLGVSSSARAQETRLANLSTRAQTAPGDAVLTVGFAIGAGSGKQVLVRAVGPTLGIAPFNISGVLSDPLLTLFNSSNVVIETNDNWGTPIRTAAISAATFSSAGAFALPAGSRDAALLTTLAPGNYTAQVTGAPGTSATGLVIVEVYEVGGTGAKLLNLSTRGQVLTGDNLMIPGIAIAAGAGTRRLLVRAAGPALAPFQLPGTLADPTVTLTNATGTATFASNNDWGTPSGTGAASATTLSAAFTQAGAFAFAPGSRDAALLVDLAPGNYTIQVTGVGGATGLAIVEVYDLTPAGPPTVTIAATKAASDETGNNSGEFTLTRTGDTLSALTVNYSVGGSATNGIDYPALLGTVTIPAGASSVKIALQALADTTVEPTETVTLTLGAGSNYVPGPDNAGTVSIADTPGSLYVATLRPASGATGSTASGLATMVLSGSDSIATVNVSFSNLSSGEAGAHLFLGNSTSAGDYVLNLPLGQVTGAQWIIQPTATYTSAQIIDALRNGLIYVGIDSANHPAGELRGAFLSAVGSQAFTPPATPPTVSLTNIDAVDAARLLTQATFGPKRSEIDALTGGAIDTWITQQLAEPPSLHRALELAEYAAVIADARTAGQTESQIAQIQNALGFRRRVWYQVVLNARDQLRQRVAFALSQIVVVGDDPFGNGHTEGITHYYDLLVNGAFGNYRTLLEQVSLNPIMGIYLSSLRNAKANPTAGTFPDENYAREVMQLFSIGLVLLQPDGTLKLDTDGLPIPTYNNTTITEMAKVFTGWGYFSTASNPGFRSTRANYINAMMLYPAEHDTSPKRIVNDVVLPAGQTGTKDLNDALDALFNHPNCAPFICRQLIQRLVTDNPSPAYIYRVAEVFDRERNSTTQLGSVVRAILTDYEARSPVVAAAPGYGKLREPLLRFTALLRSFGASSSSGRNRLENSPYTNLNQGPLESPSVFNFFEPSYVYPGPLAAAGLVAPEFQITNDTTAITVPNFFRSTIFTTATGSSAATNLVLDLAAEQALATNPSALLDHLSLVMTGSQLTAATRARITTALSGLAATTTARERAQSAILLVATALEGATQR
ncbi:MAG: DUF1800 family protein [Verrucomicrobia bacterium]|nr:DUF1800 family protein [Verrucomicrobiota bacterium]